MFQFSKNLKKLFYEYLLLLPTFIEIKSYVYCPHWSNSSQVVNMQIIHLNNPKILLAHKSLRHHGPDVYMERPPR